MIQDPKLNVVKLNYMTFIHNFVYLSYIVVL
jgi:hypothetical protein